MKQIQDVLPAWMSAEGSDQDIVFFTKLSLNRNTSEFFFPRNLPRTALPELLARGDYAAASIYGEPVSHDLSATESVKYLIEQLYLTSDMLGIGKRLNLSPDGSKGLLVNVEDHFSLIDFAAGFSPWEQLKCLEQADEQLENLFNYAVSMELGYLLSRIDKVGSGFRVEVYLHLPALSTQDYFARIIARAQRSGLRMTGFGDRKSSFGQLFRLSVDALLGSSEAETLEKIAAIVVDLIHYEREMRKYLQDSTGMEFVDLLWRDLTILQNARLLSLRESLQRFSSVCVGTSLGILPVAERTAPLLFFATQPAHLSWFATLPTFADYPAQEKEENQFRATIFREFLQPTK